MQTLRFANDDRMPILGLGTWKAAPGEVGAAVREALRIGYRHIDCAAIYGNEAEVGEALAAAMAAGDVTRDALWITSKLWNNAHAEEQVRPALEATLRDLRLDYLDLYLVHWPVAVRPDVVFPNRGDQFLSLEEVPLTATWAGMEACAREGLTRHIGVSNFSVRHLETIGAAATLPPEMNQVELHPYLQQDALRTFCRDRNIHLTAYSPLGSKDRPKGMKQADEPSLLDNPTVRDIAAAHNCTPAQVLLRWSIERGTAVIPKSTSPERLAENLAAAELRLGSAAMERLAKLERGFRYVTGTFWTIDGSPYTLDALWG